MHQLSTFRKVQLSCFYTITLACYIGSIYNFILQLQTNLTFLPFFGCLTNCALFFIVSILVISGSFFSIPLPHLCTGWVSVAIFQAFLLIISGINLAFFVDETSQIDKQIIACYTVSFCSNLIIGFIFLLKNHINFFNFPR
jgi:hypothetical protein